MNTNPIGIFDSGIGGVSVFNAIKELLPYENTLYISDNKNAPYGSKTPHEIEFFSRKIVHYLNSHNCKAVVVACNTATTNAIKQLRTDFNIPFIGIEPAIKPASLKTQTQKIGILATKGTLGSEMFFDNVSKHYSGIEYISREGTGLVTLIEAGKLHSQEIISLLKRYVTPMVKFNIDHLVLGCTHYTYLIPLLKKIIPSHIQILDAPYPVAKQTHRVLEKNNLLNVKGEGKNLFYGTGALETLQTFIPKGTVASKVFL